MGQDKGTLIKQRQGAHMKAKASERFILYIPSASNVQPPPSFTER